MLSRDYLNDITLKLKQVATDTTAPKDFFQEVPPEFYEKLYSDMTKTCFNISSWPSSQSITDTVHDVFLHLQKIFKKLDTSYGNLSPYEGLLRFCQRIVYNRHKWQKRWKFLSLEAMLEKGD